MIALMLFFGGEGKFKTVNNHQHLAIFRPAKMLLKWSVRRRVKTFYSCLRETDE